MEVRDFRPLEKRYDQEEPIRNIVDTLTSLLIDKQLTPQELGDVVAMAQIKYCSVLTTLGDAGLLSTEATANEEQRRNFAHGNVKLHNPDITRQDIDDAADRIDSAKKT